MPKNLATPAVFLIFLTGDMVLLQRRRNTGHEDGNLGLPSGKIETGESPRQAGVREGLEEVKVTIAPEALQPVHVQYNSQPIEIGGDYINHYFRVHGWDGSPSIGEPGMCSELCWVNINQLPSDVIQYVAIALVKYRDNRLQITYSEISKR